LDDCQNLEYGLWVSLSEKSFEDYLSNYNNENYETEYFGWLSNYLDGYEDTTKIPVTIFTRREGQRPEIIPHEYYNHPFVKDYYNGIIKLEAERRINEMLRQIK